MKRNSIKKMKLLMIVVLALALALGFSACKAGKTTGKNAAADPAPAGGTSSGGVTEAPGENTSGGAANEGTATVGSAASPEGEAFLNAKTKDLDGNDFDVSANKGAALTVFNVWATWCSPCVDELPAIAKAAKDFEGRDVRVIGVLLDAVGEDGAVDEAVVKDAKTILADAGVSYPSIIPDKTLIDGVLADVEAIPTTFIIGPNGELVDTLVGGMDYAAWSGAIEEALKR
jgi:thiol-disulfide isomerase/thioredoxin